MTYRYLFSVDPSLTCSGWALFSVKEGRLCAIGKIASKPPSSLLSERLQDLQNKIESVYVQLKLNSSDVLICESPTAMRDPNAAIKVEQVRSIFETLARNIGLNVPGRINPRSVQNEILGIKGKQIKRLQVKAMAVEAVFNLYSSSLKAIGFPADRVNLKKNQDIVDAILIGSLAITRMGTAKMGGIALGDIFSSSQPVRGGRIMAR
jgi:Holliday junction resolvasome RuvABC endonuclease subunit